MVSAYPLYDAHRAEIDALIAQYEEKRSALIPLAHLFQEHEGFVSPDAMATIAFLVGETLATVESTISFYTLLYRRPIGKFMMQPCRNLACTINGAESIMARFRELLGVEHLETTDDGLVSYEEVECLAACDRAPCMQINLEFVYDLTPEKVEQIVRTIRDGTIGIAPLAQNVAPAKTWRVDHEGAKSPGAVGVPRPDNAGGIGDTAGITMFDLIVGKPRYEARSNERLVRETALRPQVAEGEGH